MNSKALSRVFVVSMADARERRTAFADRAKGTGVDWKFFDALTDLAPDLVYEDAKVRWPRPLTKGEIGCYSSHFALWSQLLSDGVKQYIILEDDTIVDWKKIERLSQIDLEAHGIIYLRLHYSRPGRFSVLKRSYISRSSYILQLESAGEGTLGYVITRAAAERLVPISRQIVSPIDNHLDRYWEHGIPNLCLFPFPVMEELNESTIGNERFKDMWAKKPLWRPLRRRVKGILQWARQRAWLLRNGRAKIANVYDPSSFWR